MPFVNLYAFCQHMSLASVRDLAASGHRSVCSCGGHRADTHARAALKCAVVLDQLQSSTGAGGAPVSFLGHGDPGICARPSARSRIVECTRGPRLRSMGAPSKCDYRLGFAERRCVRRCVFVKDVPVRRCKALGIYM